MSGRPFSPETLASHWGCSAEKVRIMCKRGELASFRLGKLIRIPAAEVERYECSQSIGLERTEGSSPSSTEAERVGNESRWARMTGAQRRLSLVTSGAGSMQRRLSE